MIHTVAATEKGRAIYGFTARGLAVLLGGITVGVVGTVLAIAALSGLHAQVGENHRIVSESAIQRVKTVEQRCDLTHKILGVLERDDPQRVRAFGVSYALCEKQLAAVKQIAVMAE